MFPLDEEGGDRQGFVYELPVPGPIPAQSLATTSLGTKGLELVHRQRQSCCPEINKDSFPFVSPWQCGIQEDAGL